MALGLISGDGVGKFNTRPSLVQGAAEAHIVSYVAEGEAPDWGCDVVWKAEDPTDEESARHLENCVAVFGTIYRLVDSEDVATDEFFFKMEETASFVIDEV